jgi:enoyl-CoA hydratase
MTDILTSAANGLAHITLNRPQALHALTTHMCANMIQALLAWREDESIRAVSSIISCSTIPSPSSR